MTLLVVVSPMIVILTTVEVSFMLITNIYSTGITYNRYLRSSMFFIVEATALNIGALITAVKIYVTGPWTVKKCPLPSVGVPSHFHAHLANSSKTIKLRDDQFCSKSRKTFLSNKFFNLVFIIEQVTSNKSSLLLKNEMQNT
jgi:hypothetical protein